MHVGCNSRQVRRCVLWFGAWTGSCTVIREKGSVVRCGFGRRTGLGVRGKELGV